MSGRKRIAIADRFWEKVNKTETCWLWTAQRNNKGYGCFQVGRGRNAFAHRFSWLLAHPEGLPPGVYVLHKCDVPLCVNPEHLFIGSQRDNMADAAQKGRMHKGYKLTADDVLAIRADSRTQVQIAAAYGIAQVTVSEIKRRRIWTHLP